MAIKRKRRQLSGSAKANKRVLLSVRDDTHNPPTAPIQAISLAENGTSGTGAESSSILSLPSEILTQVLSYLLAPDSRPITLHSRSGRRWKNELHSLTTVDWNSPISVGCRDFFVARKSYKSDLLDILLVCRPFYFAGISAFFGDNLLKFDNVHHLDRLTRTLDLDRRRCIRHVCFKNTNFCNGLIGIGYPENVGPIGERLAVCLSRLPSIQTVRLIYQSPHEQSRQFMYAAGDKLRHNLEQLKEWAGEKATRVVHLEMQDQHGNVIF